MTRPLASLALGAAAAAAAAAVLTRSGGRPRMRRPNHAGRQVPVVLGEALLVGAAVGLAGLVGARVAPSDDRITHWAIGAVALLALVGAWDDRTRRPERGFRGHLASLVRGRVTTGAVKLAAGVLVALGVAVAAGGGAVRVAAATLVIAACTNLWNALDVRPGRALKGAIAALVPLLALAWEAPYAFLAASMLGASVGALPYDLRERGMLGDAGSNPIGFVVGVGFAVVLSTPWLWVAATVMLALTVAAETVTISRLIEAVPPLRWIDRAGRRA